MTSKSANPAADARVPASAVVRRRLPIGVEPTGSGEAHVRVWAPAASSLEVVAEGGAATALSRDASGYFSGSARLAVGDRYRFRIDGDALYPDPASRCQPDGPHGASVLVDPASFEWSDRAWRGTSIEGQVIYELHVGTFTREGTWAAAAGELPELAAAGITIVEMMPIADFTGRFGWGYDGVDLFAPTHLYGQPDDLRRFVDRAHGCGLGVILDVVYNHLGPDGNYLRAFSPHYFTDRHQNEWGEAINFDDDAGPVREFFISNAGYWIDEFHFDGLRLDATQQIFDASQDHILGAIRRRVHEAAAGRSTVVIAENESQDVTLVKPPASGGYGLDALWNEDYHHSAMVALTGRREGYYSDTRGEPQELIATAKYGCLFQGQHYSWQRQPRGTPSWDVPPARTVHFLQNHDQIANSPRGLRGHQLTGPARWRAMTALTLLLPSTPLIFQGQEFSASAPFLFFADFDPALNEAIRKGRAKFFEQFPSVADYVRRVPLADPADVATFERCKLDLAERQSHGAAYALHRDLLRLRREDETFRQQRQGGVDGCVLSATAFALRFFSLDHQDDRLLIVNLGSDLIRDSIADPLIAPPTRDGWTIKWSSEDPKYGGGGMAVDAFADRWKVPGESATILAPDPRSGRTAAGVSSSHPHS